MPYDAFRLLLCHIINIVGAPSIHLQSVFSPKKQQWCLSVNVCNFGWPGV